VCGRSSGISSARPPTSPTAGRTFDIGGGEVYTYADLMRCCAEEMGRRSGSLDGPVLTPGFRPTGQLVTAVRCRRLPPSRTAGATWSAGRRRVRDRPPRDFSPSARRPALPSGREEGGRRVRWSRSIERPAAEPWADVSPLLGGPARGDDVPSRPTPLSRGSAAWREEPLVPTPDHARALRGALDGSSEESACGASRARSRRLRVRGRRRLLARWSASRKGGSRLRAEMKLPRAGALTFEVDTRARASSCCDRRPSSTRTAGRTRLLVRPSPRAQADLSPDGRADRG